MERNDATTVLVTGCTGFIASWIVKYLLEQGYRVRGTVRKVANASSYAFLNELPGAKQRLTFAEADLNDPKGWTDAVRGCDYVMHVASPYILSVKDAWQDLVNPAVQGTLRVFHACLLEPKIKRIILTSSVAAISDSFDDWKSHVYGPNDWNESSSVTRNPYFFSKAEAERAAHKFMSTERPHFSLVVINPFEVLGPALNPDASLNQSVETVAGYIRGEMPVNLPLNHGVCDVRDVALAHVRAMQVEKAGGLRIIVWSGNVSSSEMARIIKVTIPADMRGYIPSLSVHHIPRFLVVAFARISKGSGEADFVATTWAKIPIFDVTFAREVLDLKFTSPDKTIEDTAKNVVDILNRKRA